VRFTNWYLAEWLAYLGMSQAQLVREADLDKTTVSLLVNARQDYSPELTQAIADAMNIAVYELFMPPEEAAALKQLRRDALQVVRTSTALERTGTDG